MLSTTDICPYQDCGQDLTSRKEFCSCALTRTLTLCAACGAENRAAARFCRRCRADLPECAAWKPDSLDGRVTYLNMPGAYRRPPLPAFDSLFAVNTAGHLVTLALRAGAASTTVAELPAATSCNGAVLVDVPSLGKASPGWTFVAVHPEGVEAVVLNTGEVRTLHEVKSGAELAANSPGFAASFRALVSDGVILAFAERSGPSRVALVVRSLADGQPADRPLMLEGREVIGPVWHAGLLVLCTGEEVGVYDTANQPIGTTMLPRNFSPLAARRQDSLNVPPGSIPLTAERTSQGVTVHVGGQQNGVPGLLSIEMQTGLTSFDPLGQSGSITSNADGSLTLAAENEVRVVGNGKQTAERIRLQSGMPASFEASTLFAFTEETRRGLHQVAVITPARGKVSELAFEDVVCTQASCCAPVKTARGLAIPYFDALAEGSSGSKIAFWSAGSPNQ